MTDELLLEGEPFSFQPELYDELNFEESAADKRQRAQSERDCKGVRVLEWLEKDGPSSLREYIEYLERRLKATPRLVQGHENLRKLRGMRLPKDKFSASWQGLVRAFPEIQGRYFYSDLCSGWLRSFVFSGGAATGHRQFIDSMGTVISFGEDGQQELLVLTAAGQVLRIHRVFQ